MSEEFKKMKNFIQQKIHSDLENKKVKKIITRFPPEPNGFLHIGHAKSIVLNFYLSQVYKGTTNLRFDDTNPETESKYFVDEIKKDIDWLGYKWTNLFFASDYFQEIYECAIKLISQGKAYVCDLSYEEMKKFRGTLTEKGTESPYRDRSISENIDLFQKMRLGEFPNGSKTLRAKIDMNSPNINLRDPVLYRIKNNTFHHQTGKSWCIFPMYDFCHPISDALEGITHSLCTLEFEDHRPLYDWIIENVGLKAHPSQIEFARLNIEYMVMSKRKLAHLVNNGNVDGWDDPRMPTIAGLRRRGYTSQSIKDFCMMIGVTKVDSVIEFEQLESAIRSDLDPIAPRRMAVLNPLKIIISNFSDDNDEKVIAPNHPKYEKFGHRQISFSKEIFIERDDFRETANKKFKRLIMGEEVRLRHSYVIKAEKVIKDGKGEIIEVHCSYDPNTLGKNPDDRKVKGVIHWVSARQNKAVEIRLYDRLFNVPNPAESDNFTHELNPNSLVVMRECRVEQALLDSKPGDRFQFEREGYFCRDLANSADGLPVFNRIVTLRDSWNHKK
tara:strand:+ start:3985 stop:5649 length:1665 start_codon:yes stop_codon:yes gene_type:complete